MPTDTTQTVAGNRLTLIVDGPERLAALIGLIGGARSSLSLYYYIFAGDAAGQQVRAALLDALGRGVAVTLMIDAFGSGSTDDYFFEPLVTAGARFGRFGTRRSTLPITHNCCG